MLRGKNVNKDWPIPGGLSLRNATTVMLALADEPFMLPAHKQAPWLTLERGSVDRFFLPLEVQ